MNPIPAFSCFGGFAFLQHQCEVTLLHSYKTLGSPVK